MKTEFREMLDKLDYKKCLAVALLVLLAVISFFVIADKTSQPDTFAGTAESIDAKVETVLKLTATSSLASVGVSAIPGDTATPIADKLADFTEYFLLILCVLYSEKYLLSIIGLGVFKIVIPLACLAGIITVVKGNEFTKKLAVKAVLIGLAIFIVIPASVGVSDLVYDRYQNSIDSAIESAEELSDETSAFTDNSADADVVSSILSKISESVDSLTEKASSVLYRFVESLAVMLVTACVIPLLVLLFFLWLVKLITGREITVPLLMPHGKHRSSHTSE